VFDDKDSLALKSLQEGVVDFTDARVQIKGAAMGSQIREQELFEVELGELKSMRENQVHIEEMKRQGLAKG
jgi:hypothetical protein